jgi:hypothetical protein
MLQPHHFFAAQRIVRFGHQPLAIVRVNVTRPK